MIDPEYRGKDILLNMVETLMLFSLAHNCGYLFVLAPRLNAMHYRRVCKQLKTTATIHKDINLPDKPIYRELDVKLLSCVIKHLSVMTQPVLTAI